MYNLTMEQDDISGENLKKVINSHVITMLNEVMGPSPKIKMFPQS